MADTAKTTGIDELDLDAAFDEGYDPLADIDFEGDEEVDFPVGDGSNLKQAEHPEVQPLPAHDARQRAHGRAVWPHGRQAQDAPGNPAQMP